MDTMLPLNQLESVLKDNGTVDEEMLRRIIKENANDGGLLRKAAKEGYLNVVKFFLEAKYKFELTAQELWTCSNTGAADKKGNTPIHLAASNGHAGIVGYILSSGEADNIVISSEESPLFLAVREGHKSVARLLVIHFAAYLNPGSIEFAATTGRAAVVRELLMFRWGRGRALSCAAEAGHADVVALILKRCADGGLSDLEHLALHQAARRGHIHIVEMILNAGGDASRIDDDGFTPMACAAQHGHMDIVQLLLSRGAQPLSNANKSPLDCAVANGHKGIARLLRSHGFTLNTMFVLREVMEKGRPLATLAVLAMGESLNSITGRTALHIACAGKHLEMVCFLLQRKVNVNARDDSLNTPLHKACMYSGNESIIKLLIDHGAIVNALNQDGCTPLWYANDLPAQRILIESGGDPHLPNNTGTTALHKATTVESVLLFLQCNVLVDARTKEGVTPLMDACSQGGIEIAETLIEYNARVNTTDLSGETPLFKAIGKGSNECVKLLLENGAVVNCEYKENKKTPLHVASWNNDFKSAQLLLKWGAAVNAENSTGDTPLFFAAGRGAYSIMQLLIESGAHVNSVNNKGQIALHVVSTERDAEILIRKGADVSLKDKKGMTPRESLEYNEEMFAW